MLFLVSRTQFRNGSPRKVAAVEHQGRGPSTALPDLKEKPMKEQPTVKITLTPEQQAQIEQATGKPATRLQLKLEALEERLAPGVGFN
jgi:hypothetical protein